MRPRRAARIFGGAALVLAVHSPAAAQSPSRLTLDQPDDGVAFVEAFYPTPEGETCPAKIPKPLRARYRGRLEIVQAGNGRLAVIDHLTFPQYLAGLAEVPRSWPSAALEAQVIAARSYALSRLARVSESARRLGYDICSTDRCQVYRGVAVEQGAFGERWVQAVGATAGLALVHDGRPIQAFYFSTSSGRTRSNAEAFGGSPLPYLRSVDGQDGDAPLARWSVPIPLADLAAILARAGRWPGGAIQTVRRDGDAIVVAGGGRSVRMEASAFRREVNAEAACAFPDRYPVRRDDGSRLPQTILSSRFEVSVAGGTATIAGRGWGHDVGMSQYGARSLAERGRSAAEILAYFYGGLKPTRVAEPESIRVLVVESAVRLRVTPEAGGTLRAGGSVYGPGPSYEVTPASSGPQVARVSGAATTPALRLADLQAVAQAEHGLAETRFTLSAPARVSAVVERDGVEVRRVAESSLERGPQSLSVPLGPGAPGRAVAGLYEISLEAYDGIDRVRASATILVAAPPDRSPFAPPAAPRRIVVAAAAALALGAGAGMGALLRRRRR